MNRDECKQYIQGAIGTLPTAFDQRMNIDHGKMAEYTKWWVSEGLGKNFSGLKVAAAMGEGPFMTPAEWPALLSTVVTAAGPEANVLCALQVGDTLRTIEDAKRAQGLGAKGLQIDLPFMSHPTQDDLYRHFSDISAKIDIGIMIYNLWWFGAEPISIETCMKLAKNTEHVVGIKWNTPEISPRLVPPGADYSNAPVYDDMKKIAAEFNIIDNSGQMVRCHKNGGRGFISSMICAHPASTLTMWSLLEAKKYDEAQKLQDTLNKPFGEFIGRHNKMSAAYRFVKGLMDVTGHPVGPSRPPTLPLNEAEYADLRNVVKGFGWKTS